MILPQHLLPKTLLYDLFKADFQFCFTYEKPQLGYGYLQKPLYIFRGKNPLFERVDSYLWESIIREGGAGFYITPVCRGALPSFGCVVPTVFDELSSLV